MIEKSPINYQIAHLASCMDPVYATNENAVESCTLKFSKLVEKLRYLKKITSKVGDDATEYKDAKYKIQGIQNTKYKDKFLEFNEY